MSDVATFWTQARDSLGYTAQNEIPGAWAFGDSPAMADELLDLVLAGTKTATASALWDYEAEDEPVPEPGDLSIILDGAGAPRAVIETVEVRVRPMKEVDAAFAYDEGEDDRTLASWWDAHERFFRRYLPRIGRDFDPAMPVVLERFRLRHPRLRGPSIEW